MKKTIVNLMLLAVTGLGFAQDKVVLHAEIANRNGDVLFIKNSQSKVVGEMKVDSKGAYDGKFVLEEGMYFLYDGKRHVPIYLSKDSNLKIKGDAKILYYVETLVVEGKGAIENNFMKEENKIQGAIDRDAINIIELDQTTFDKKIAEIESDFLSRIKKAKLRPLFVKLQKESFAKKMNRIRVHHKEKMEVEKLNGMVSASFDYENHKGGKTKLEDLRGKYVYIDFWATWCGPCKAEIPFLQKIEEEYRGKNIEFVSISIDAAKDHDKWKAFVDEKKLGGIQLIADNNWESAFVKSYKVTGIPQFILLDPTGKIVKSDAPRPSNPKLKELLDSLLN